MLIVEGFVTARLTGVWGFALPEGLRFSFIAGRRLWLFRPTYWGVYVWGGAALLEYNCGKLSKCAFSVSGPYCKFCIAIFNAALGLFNLLCV